MILSSNEKHFTLGLCQKRAVCRGKAWMSEEVNDIHFLTCLLRSSKTMNLCSKCFAGKSFLHSISLSLFVLGDCISSHSKVFRAAKMGMERKKKWKWLPGLETG